MNELALRITTLAREHFNYRGTVVHGQSTDPDYLVDNPSRRRPDITKARTQLGYEPRISLDAGLERTLLWYAGNPAATEA